MVESIINLELAYINTMHPEFRRDADIGLFFQSDKLNEKKDGNGGFHILTIHNHKHINNSNTFHYKLTADI